MIQLRAINEDNFEECLKLHTEAAQKFWRSLGFQLTDDLESGYRYMRLYVGENEAINKEDQHE